MGAYAITIFSGAFLLFLVQPLIGRYILPWFGGGPGVWAACLLFFQLLLLAGYGYAHWLTSRLKPRRQVVVHLVLAAAALAMLPIVPKDAWKPAPSGSPVLQILLLLARTVGLPYFLLSTTGPLMQRWLSLTQKGAIPYRLYALSNVGSLLALLIYPFVLEPKLTRWEQAIGWSAGLGVFVIALAACAWRVWHSGVLEASPAGESQPEADAPPPTRGVRWMWFLLPACASTLLLAVTNKVCQDVAVIPFLWVLPLSLYLLSFIISFDSPRWYGRAWFGLLYFGGVAAVCQVLFVGIHLAIWKQVAAFGGALFCACMVCHGELYRLKPSPRYLTVYYLWISAGGAAGGLLVALLAPHLLPDNYEFQGALLLPGVLLLLLFLRDNVAVMEKRRYNRYAALLVSAILMSAVALVVQVRYAKRNAILSARNFYGTLTVYEYNPHVPESHYYLLQHGQITHGMQFTDLIGSRWATSYYGKGSGIEVAIDNYPRKGGRRIGLVGLGTGSATVYGRKGDVIRIYEINPLVEKISRSQFTYLKNCEAAVEVVPGDARLSMEREAPQQYDFIILDAFSSDAIPVHLLTREAFAVYRRHLRPEGVILVHISNRYLNLEPVVFGLAADAGLKTAMVNYTEDDDTWWLYSSTWVLVTANGKWLEQPDIKDFTSPPRKWKPIRLWTDDFSSLFDVVE